MANIFKNPVHNSQQGYNGFDMSHILKFSSTVGELLPVFYDILQPSDKVSIQTELRTRTMPLRTAAMASIKEHIDWFFVPMTQIFSIFGDWFYGIQDFKSSLFDPSQFTATTAPNPLPFFTAPTMKTICQGFTSQNDFYFVSASIKGTQCRLMEMLGYPVAQFLAADNAATAAGLTGAAFAPLCPLLFCAYQKIYFDYYRLSDRESNKPKAYNLDAFYAQPEMSTLSSGQEDIFRLRYRPRQKDFFTNLFASPLYNSQNDSTGYPSQSQYVNIANDWLSSGTYFSPVLLSVNGISSEGVTAENGTQIGSARQATSQIRDINQTAMIRTNFAIEKMLEITRRAGKHVDDQTLAHFGIKPNQGLSGECRFIGSSVSSINIGDVIATSSGDNVSLGEIAGKGYGYNKSGTFKFEAPFHGILMGIYSAVPDTDYYGVGMDKLNILHSRSDWFMQEFDNLGMQPLFTYQAYIDPSSTGGWIPGTRLGWQYRYSELKCKYNRIVGALNYQRTLKDWSIGYIQHQNSYPYFLVNPTMLNTIMLGNYGFIPSVNDTTTWFQNDPLLHELYLDVKKSSKMSTYSLPQL